MQILDVHYDFKIVSAKTHIGRKHMQNQNLLKLTDVADLKKAIIEQQRTIFHLNQMINHLQQDHQQSEYHLIKKIDELESNQFDNKMQMMHLQNQIIFLQEQIQHTKQQLNAVQATSKHYSDEDSDCIYLKTIYPN